MGLNREGRRVDKFVYCSLDFVSGLKLQKFFYMWHSPLNGIGRRMAPFAIYSLPDSRVKCLSPLVGVPVIAHQQRLTFSCSSPFRCSHLTPSSSIFPLPYTLTLYSEPTISSFVLNMHTLFIYSFLLATRQVSSSQCSASAISNYPLRESEKKGEILPVQIM